MKITAAIITKSEKINSLVLASLDFAEEIVIVVDSKEKKNIQKGKTHTYYKPLSNDFSAQRNYALSRASNNWVLFVDDDEYVGTELALEILSMGDNHNYSGFLINRLDVCFHQPLLHGETGKIKLLRLAKKNSGKFARPVHEIWKVKGQVGQLNSPLYHIKNNLVGEFIGRMIQYSDIDSEILKKEGKPFSIKRLLLNPIGKFFQNYFFKLGILDGTVGLISAYLMSVQSITVRVYQWTKRK